MAHLLTRRKAAGCGAGWVSANDAAQVLKITQARTALAEGFRAMESDILRDGGHLRAAPGK